MLTWIATMVESMYIEFPANASHEEFLENKNSAYKVRIAERSWLPVVEHEVALVDMLYDNNWYNVHNTHLTV